MEANSLNLIEEKDFIEELLDYEPVATDLAGIDLGDLRKVLSKVDITKLKVGSVIGDFMVGDIARLEVENDYCYRVCSSCDGVNVFLETDASAGSLFICDWCDHEEGLR